MVNKVWDIVNEDRVKPPQPEEHELGEEIVTPEAIVAATTAANKYDKYLEDYTRATCPLAESISDAELVAITTVLDDPVAIWAKLQLGIGIGEGNRPKGPFSVPASGDRDCRGDNIKV